MKIKFISEDDLNAIKNNLDVVYQKFVKESKSLKDIFENETIIKETTLQFNDFKLDMSQPKGDEVLTDAENIQRVYNNMKFLTDSQASDERLWAALAFSDFQDYMKYRWSGKDENIIKNRYLFGYSAQRSLFRNGIARLWWIGRVTYDENRTDPYELTKFLCKNQNYIEASCGRNIFNNHEIGLAIIGALYDAEKAGVKVDRKVFEDIAKYVNVLAGIYLLDAMDPSEVYEKVRQKLKF